MNFPSPAKRARLLATLLLASLAWGTTVEFNHHHGTRVRFDQSLLSTTQNADDASSVKIESSKKNGTRSSSKTGACLICQLHQNLSATALCHQPGVGTAETHGLKATPSVVLLLSEFTLNCQGRAPPSYL